MSRPDMSELLRRLDALDEAPPPHCDDCAMNEGMVRLDGWYDPEALFKALAPSKLEAE